MVVQVQMRQAPAAAATSSANGTAATSSANGTAASNSTASNSTASVNGTANGTANATVAPALLGIQAFEYNMRWRTRLDIREAATVFNNTMKELNTTLSKQHGLIRDKLIERSAQQIEVDELVRKRDAKSEIAHNQEKDLETEQQRIPFLQRKHRASEVNWNITINDLDSQLDAAREALDLVVQSLKRVRGPEKVSSIRSVLTKRQNLLNPQVNA